MRILAFILLFPFNSIAQDALLQVMMSHWTVKEAEPVHLDADYLEDEPEEYHWELGTPDNIPDVEVIYDEPSPCGLTYP